MMDNQDIRTLKILEEIDNGHVPSQRDLARKLNVSLGLVNSFIKRLAQKGYFKINTIPKNRVRYILTPKGATEKTRLTYEYIQYSFQFYKDSRKKLKRFFKEIEAQSVRRIVFYGVSDFAEISYLSLQETNIILVAMLDHGKVGHRFFNMVVANPDQLYLYDYDRIIITDSQHREKIQNQLIAEGVSRKKILFLD